VGVPVAVGVKVGSAVGVDVGVGVGINVSVGVGVKVGVGVGTCKINCIFFSAKVSLSLKTVNRRVNNQLGKSFTSQVATGSLG
jgi:DsbC/DsbD-like thiol-disulfide interchange protein